MKVLTQSPLPSAVIEMSTGSGIFSGSPIVPTCYQESARRCAQFLSCPDAS
jgi:hypothetical protein